MNIEELLIAIDMEHIEDMEYFEQFALLMEHPDEIEYELFYEVISKTDPHILTDLTNSYFEDIIQGVPDDSIDLYTMLSNIKVFLKKLSKQAGSINGLIQYVEELYRFRTWYMFDAVAHYTKEEEREYTPINVYDALTLFRMEKLNSEKYCYDFTNCLDYHIDEEYEAQYDEAFDEEDLEEEEDEIFAGLDERDELEGEEDLSEYGIDRKHPVIDFDPNDEY